MHLAIIITLLLLLLVLFLLLLIIITVIVVVIIIIPTYLQQWDDLLHVVMNVGRDTAVSEALGWMCHELGHLHTMQATVK